MKYLAVILCIAITIPVFGQRKRKNDEEVIPTYKEGIVYSLPRTGIRIHVTALQETVMAGPFNGYAEQMLGIKNAPAGNSVNWKIVDVKLETFAEPDPEVVFKAIGENGFLINLTPEGILAGINSEHTVTGIAPVKTNLQINKPEQDDGFSFDYITDTPFYTPGDSTNGYRPVRVTDEQKAAEAAQRILECRMNQYDLAAGMLDELHPDGEAYKISLQQLKKIERDYLSLFAGRKTYKSEQFSIDFVPNKSSGKSEVLFRVSDEKGIVPASDLSGKPVMIEFEREQDLTKKYAELASSENPAAGESGVNYRMPGCATINIIYELNTIASTRATIAQFGEIASFPEDLLYDDISVEFHPETGAVKSITKK